MITPSNPSCVMQIKYIISKKYFIQKSPSPDIRTKIAFHIGNLEKKKPNYLSPFNFGLHENEINAFRHKRNTHYKYRVSD